MFEGHHAVPVDVREEHRALAEEAKALLAVAFTPNGLEAALNRSNGVEGWSLQEIPWTTDAGWKEYVRIAGEANIKIVSLGAKMTGDTSAHSGALLVSPKGMERLQKHVEKKERETAKNPESYR